MRNLSLVTNLAILVAMSNHQLTALERHNRAERESPAKRLQEARERELRLKADRERIEEAAAKRARKAVRRAAISPTTT